MRYSLVDAFAGAGGLSLGLTLAGFEASFSFDNDKICIETMENNPKYFSHRVECLDIDKLLALDPCKYIGIKKNTLFLLAGGPPCQGFSVQRQGDDFDPRNQLVMKYIQLAAEQRPHYVLMENVPGLKGPRGEVVLNEAIRVLLSEGYFCTLQEIDAQAFSVPQRRRRIFLLAERDSCKYSPLSIPLPESFSKITVHQTISHLPEPNSPDNKDPLHRADRLSELNKKRLESLKQGQGREHLPQELLAACHVRGTANQIGHRNVYGRMSWHEVAPTITARFDSFTRGLFGHPTQSRSISLREGALLQTFPLDYHFCGTKVEVARQIGNAVPVKLAEALGRYLIEHHKQKLQNQNNNRERRKVA